MGINYGPKVTAKASNLIFSVDAANSKSYSGSGNNWKDISPRALTFSPPSTTRISGITSPAEVTGTVRILLHGATNIANIDDVAAKLQIAKVNYPNLTLNITTRNNGTWSDINTSNYDVVFLFSDSSMTSSASPTLDNFAAAGGGIVAAMFTQSVAITGLTTTLLPLVPMTGGQANTISTLDTAATTHPVVKGLGGNTTVTSFRTEGYVTNTAPTLNPGASTVASYTNGKPAVVIKQTNYNSVWLNFYPPSATFVGGSWNSTNYPDGAKLMLNAVLWAAKKFESVITYNSATTEYNSLTQVSFSNQAKTMYFNGSSYARFFDLPNVDYLTVSAMVYLDAWSGTTAPMTFVSNCGADGLVYYQIGINNSLYSSNVGCLVKTPLGVLSTGISRSTLSAGWHVLTMTFDGTALKFYVDGAQVSTTSSSSSTSVSKPSVPLLGIGAQAFVSGVVEPTTGYVSSVKVYNTALSASDVFSEYTSLVGRFIFVEPNIVKTNLDIWFDASNPSSYSGSGTSWKDVSGNSKNGTLMNAPTYAAGPGRFTFNGTNQYVAAPASSVTSANGTSTLECWAFLTNPSKGPLIGIGFGLNGHFLGVGDSNLGGDAFSFSGNQFKFYITYTQILTIGSFSTNGWYHLALTKNDTAYTFYVNGVLTSSGGSSAGLNPDTGSYISYMRYYSAIPEFFGNNTVAVGRIYNRVLSLADVQQNFNAERGRYGV